MQKFQINMFFVTTAGHDYLMSKIDIKKLSNLFGGGFIVKIHISEPKVSHD